MSSVPMKGVVLTLYWLFLCSPISSLSDKFYRDLKRGPVPKFEKTTKDILKFIYDHEKICQYLQPYIILSILPNVGLI